MRRSVLTGIALLAAGFSAVGCEDGPNQTYNPAPSGAAGSWNNAGPDASTSDPGAQGFDGGGGGGGTNAVNICTAAQQSAAWAKVFAADIKPPFSIGGVDLSAGNTFGSVRIEDLLHGTNGQPQLCQGNAGLPCNDGSGQPSYTWGAQQQLQICYDAATHSVASSFEMVQPGYTGQLKFTLPKTVNGQAVPLAVDDSGNPADLNFVIDVRGEAMTLNGQPLTGSKGKALWANAYNGGVGGIEDTRAQQMYLGLMYTYQPTLLSVTDKTVSPPLTELTDPNAAPCLATTKCRTSLQANDGNFGVRPVGIYFDVGLPFSTNTATAASPVDIYMYPAKFEPYSLAPYNLGLDTYKSANSDPNLLATQGGVYGPYAAAGVLSPTGATPFCTLYMGSLWKDFLGSCVNVSGDPNIDKTSLAKLLGGQHHADEWFNFSIFGVNQNFSADTAQLTQNGQPGVLQDNQQVPADDSVATDFILDVRSSGDRLNDMFGDQSPSAPPPTCVRNKPSATDARGLTCTATCTQVQCDQSHVGSYDLHGTAAVEGYYRALVLDAIHAEMTKVGMTYPTNPASCWFDATTTSGPGAAAQTLETWQAPAGCTGFEMMITPSEPSAAGTLWTDQLDKGPILNRVPSIFKPGDPGLSFVADPAHGFNPKTGAWSSAFAAGTSGVGNNAFITQGNLLQASLQQVVAVLGHGNMNNLPPAVRDWRFYLVQWANAYLGYSLNRHLFTTNGLTWRDLYADHVAATHTGWREVNQDNLFFDLFNGVDKFEYVDRTNASTLGAPLDFEYDILLYSSNVQNFNYFQRLTRDESALYSAMLQDKTQVPGSNENVNLSDLFGAPAIANAGVSGGSPPGGAGHDPWYCATHGTPLAPVDDCPNGPPTDANNNVLLDGEGRPLFTSYKGIWNNTTFTLGSQIPIKTELPYITSAIVNLPNYADPYDTTSTNTPLETIVTPWIPFQPGNGIEIPINGQRSQFVQTGSLDFSGVTVTTNVDYQPVLDKNGNETAATIVAVETQDFLGEVFPCVDPTTGDILRVRMYSSVLDILNWFENHPGAQTACNVYIRYSPYNNYPDIITSIANGVMINVNAGATGGYGRVGDATLFQPSLLTQTQ
jgi:hypothetical protein